MAVITEYQDSTMQLRPGMNLVPARVVVCGPQWEVIPARWERSPAQWEVMAPGNSAAQPTPAPPAERAAAGGVFLDERMPRWPYQVDLGHLSMESPYQCILGQLGGYTKMITALGLGVGDAVRLGFQSQVILNQALDFSAGTEFFYAIREDYVQLTDAWTDQVKARVNA